ncbi:cora-like Mg2+ transporter protein-domain-containing protein [Nemania abortiva]|nr:cora-like Mg2+ transporter protein-domain-containing protein [Nemania abortiva]
MRDSILRSDQCNSGDSYLVQDYSGDSDLLHSAALTKPEIPMEGCTQCSGGFTNLGDGIAHLSSVHFSSNSTALPDSASEKLRLWLRTPDQVQLEARIHTFLTFMEECIGAFEKLIKVADDLRLGSISVGDTGGVGGYPVIESLVRVFEHITIILVFACDFMVKAEKAMRKDHRKALNGKKFRGQFKVSLHRIIQGAQKNLEQAKIDMILASRTERRQGVVTLASIGPELIIAMISNGLFFRKLGGTQGISTSSGGNVDGDNVNTEDIDVGEVYKMYANKLQLQVNQRPQKRLLPDIYALEEELDILHRLNRWQRKFCLDFLRVLDPSSYKITTKARFSHFKTEDRYLRKTLRRLEVRGSELHSLQQRTEKLRDQLRQNIEIEEESHGKAIRVFTFVTIFFLPLSFVTSFFGMNTVDIRNIDQDQRLFWIVSVPTTAFVIGIAYLYGYKWEHWKERFSRPRGSRVINPATEHAVRILQPFGLRRLLQETTNKDDLEKGGFRRQESGFSLRSIESVKDKARRPMHLWRNRNSK